MADPETQVEQASEKEILQQSFLLAIYPFKWASCYHMYDKYVLWKYYFLLL